MRRLLAIDFAADPPPLASTATAISQNPTAILQNPTAPIDAAAESQRDAERGPDEGRAPEGEPRASVHFRFVYPNDADPSGYFRNHPERKVLLEQAGRMITDRLSDTLDAIPPLPPGVTFQPQYNNPATGASKNVASGFTVGANEIVVFVGSRNLQSLDADPTARTIAYAQGIDNYGFSFNCTNANLPACNAFGVTLQSRGEGNVTGAGAVDFAPILGSITFDTRASTLDNMYLEQGAFEQGQFRFLTFAQHELAHILGFGLAESYFARFAGNGFNGAAARRVFGGAVPLDPPNGNHLARSVADQGLTIMGPQVDTPDLITELDFAVLDDIGWSLIADSRPTVTLNTPDLVLVESTGTFEITATLSAATSSTITLPVALSGVAAGTSDVRLSTPDFVFPPNQRTATISVNVIDDAINETTEVVAMAVTGTTNVKLGADTGLRLTVLDDDGVELSEVPRMDPASLGNTIEIPGDNQPRAIVFRAAANRTLRITANNVDQISEAVLLLDKDQNVIGTYGSTGLTSASLVAGESYAVLFYPRQTTRTFTLSLPGGFAAAVPRTNVLFPPDVNGSSAVTEVDALQIINQLNRALTDPSVDAATVTGNGFYDVSGDGLITAVDALQVINFLNTNPPPSSEPPTRDTELQGAQMPGDPLSKRIRLDEAHRDAATPASPRSPIRQAVRSRLLHDTPATVDLFWADSGSEDTDDNEPDDNEPDDNERLLNRLSEQIEDRDPVWNALSSRDKVVEC